MEQFNSGQIDRAEAAQQLQISQAHVYRQRAQFIRTIIITTGEIAVRFEKSELAFEWLARWKIYPLHQGIAEVAADVDRALKKRLSSGRK